MRTILVSRCLLGAPCRYDGRCGRPLASLLAVHTGLKLVPICPEVDGGLSTPRPAAEIAPGADGHDVLAGRAGVFNTDGDDVTHAYVTGAHQAVVLAWQTGATQAFLRARSPSCGCRAHYDGRFSGHLASGPGVTAAALQQAGLTVADDSEDNALAKLLNG